MKRDKLYTVNKHNKNLFEYGGPTQPTAMLGNRFETFDNKALVDNNMKQVAQNAQGAGSSGGFNWGGAAMGAASAIPNTPMQIGSNTARNGIWDAADPTWYLADGRESKVGNALSDTGVAVTKAGAQSGNPWIMLGGAALKIGGSLVNAIGGTKEITKNTNAMRNNTSRAMTTGNMMNSAQTTDALMNAASGMAGGFDVGRTQDLYKGGWSRKSRRKARNKAKDLIAADNSAMAYQTNSLATAAQNVDSIQDSSVMSNFAALGGQLDTGGSEAIDYGFMSDFLTYKNKQTDNKGMFSSPFSGVPSTMFAFGGDLQTHGSDWSTGLVTIGAGGTHEENKYDGVQLGRDENLVPNLVEEGETVWNDYVFSNRISIDDATKKRFHIGKNRQMSYAELSKKLEKEAAERPNDPISRAALRAQMETLAEQQERQKQEIEQQRMQEMWDSMTPEQKAAVLQQAQAQEQAVAQQQAMAEQQAMQQPSEEELAAMQQQQMMQADGSEAMIGQQPQMNACGGKLHKFDKGGELFKRLGFSTMPEFIRWINENGISLKSEPDWSNMKFDSIPWKELMDNPTFKQAAMKRNATLLDALSRGYDFGEFVPPTVTTGYDWNNFWTPVNEYSKQKGNSADKYKVDNTYSGDIKELENSDAYKAFTDYILNDASDEERLKYLKWIDENTGRENKYIGKNGKLRNDWKDLFKEGRTDGLYGIQHYTPKFLEDNRGNKATNLVYDDETGQWTEVYGNIGKDWTLDNTYSWDDEDNSNIVNYYRRSASATPTPSSIEQEEGDIVPNYRNDKLRYAGLFGPAVGLGLMAAGVGKPKFGELDAALDYYDNSTHGVADYRPIGNYLTYRPMDIWAEQNRLDANARATDRAIMNSSSPSRMAGLLANGYNTQLADGELYRKALEYNDANRAKVADFNRGTDMFNANAYNQTSQTNAQMQNQNRQARANLAAQIAAQKLDARANWYNSLYGNVAGLFKGIGDLGRENYQYNQMVDELGSGAFPGVTQEQLIKSGLYKRKKGR